MIRTYRVVQGVVVLPKHLSEGIHNTRVPAGEIFTTTEDDIFIRKSLARGDIALVDEAAKKGAGK